MFLMRRLFRSAWLRRTAAYLTAAAVMAGIYTLGYMLVAYLDPGASVPFWVSVLLVLGATVLVQPLTRALRALFTWRPNRLNREQLETWRRSKRNLPRRPPPRPRAIVKVLIITEDTDLTRNLHAMLLESGYVSETAASAAAALILSQRQHYDAALVDTDLPGETAWEVARQLVSWSGSASVVFLCRWDAAADLTRLMQAGISAVVLKPPLKEDLIAKLRRVTAQAPADSS